MTPYPHPKTSYLDVSGTGLAENGAHSHVASNNLIATIHNGYHTCLVSGFRDTLNSLWLAKFSISIRYNARLKRVYFFQWSCVNITKEFTFLFFLSGIMNTAFLISTGVIRKKFIKAPSTPLSKLPWVQNT